MDTNNDTMVDVSEINHFIIYGANNPGLEFSGASAMELCDKNGDNMLSEEDYDDENSCLNINALNIIVCSFCKSVV